jgi:hypothetical protein
VKIRDVRGLKEPIKTIDEKGFVYRKHKTKVPVEGFLSRETVEKDYLPEVEELIKGELEGVDRLFFFDWRVCLFVHILSSSSHCRRTER